VNTIALALSIILACLTGCIIAIVQRQSYLGLLNDTPALILVLSGLGIFFLLGITFTISEYAFDGKVTFDWILKTVKTKK